MPAGRSPPIIPSLAALTSSRSAGRKPLALSYKLAAQRRRERQRMAKGMKQIAAIGGAVGPPKRIDVLAARTAVAPSRLRRRTGIVPQRHDQTQREAEPAATAEPAPEPRSLRPPRVEASRYAALKNQPPH